MSLIIVTPTQVACDYMEVIESLPKKTTVNLTRHKLSINPSNTMIIGAAGFLDSTKLAQSPHVEVLERCMREYMKHSETHLDSYYKVLDNGLKEGLSKISDKAEEIILVTKTHRCKLVFWIDKEKDKNSFLFCKISEIHTNGAVESLSWGMVVGGIDLRDIFKICRQHNAMVSEECMILDITSLSDWSEV